VFASQLPLNLILQSDAGHDNSGEAMLFGDLFKLKGPGQCMASVLSCEQHGVMSAIHPILLEQIQARMLQE